MYERLPRPRGRIDDPSEIVDAALAIIRARGVVGLSMRRLATELGVNVAVTYYYFADKDALVDAVADRVVRRILAADDPALDWKDRLVRLIAEQNKLLTEHLGIASFLVTNRQSDSALRWCDGFLSVLLASGMTEENVAVAFATVAFYINPMFLVEHAPSVKARMFPEADRVRELTNEFTALRRMQPYLDEIAHADEYVFGARQLVESLERRLNPE